MSWVQLLSQDSLNLCFIGMMPSCIVAFAAEMRAHSLQEHLTKASGGGPRGDEDDRWVFGIF